MKLSWNWLKDYVSTSISAQAAAECLTAAGLEVKKIEKVGNDYMLETEITSNRPDWLSHIGVAREIAALYNKPLKIPKLSKIRRTKTAACFSVKTPEKKSCPYYTGTILEGLSVVKTPEEMRDRLQVCGVRSINFIVDVTNYVLLECGQPLHAFDLEKLNGSTISARKAMPGEQITAINGSVYKLDQADCVIADEKKPVAIGGVMGGSESEVSDNTRHILIESAYFAPGVIRKTSKRLKLASDSSYRFERGVDPLGVDWARERAISLIAESCKPSAVGFVLKSGAAPIKKKKVTLEISEVSQVLGVEIAASKSKRILNQLDIPCTQKGGKLIANVPSFRGDIGQSVDLIEEIARIYGYGKIPATLPGISIVEPRSNPLLDLQEQCRDWCAGFGLQEAVTFSMINPDAALLVDKDQSNWVRIDNPRNNQLTLMRPNFVSSLLQVVRHNLNAGVPSAAIFEVGNRYWSSGKELPIEDRTLAIALSGETPLHWMDKIREYHFFHLKGMFDSILGKFGDGIERRPAHNRPFLIPGEGFEIRSGTKKIGEFGSIRKQCLESFDIEKPVFFGEISLTELSGIERSPALFRELDKYPKVTRDLSVMIEDKISSRELIEAVRSCGSHLIRAVDVFDLYRGGKLPKDRKSISLRITYQSGERTLETVEVNTLHFSIIEQLSKRFHATLPPKSNP